MRLRLLPLLGLLILLGACRTGRLEAERQHPAELLLEFYAGQGAVPTSIRFHPAPAAGQWALFRHDDVLIRSTVIAHIGRMWIIEQLIQLPDSGQTLRIDLQVDDRGRVVRASGTALSTGRDPLGPLVLPLVPAAPDVATRPAPQLPPLATASPVAGLPTGVLRDGPFSWCFAEGAYFAVDLAADPEARLGLVQSSCKDRINCQLIAQGRIPREDG